MAQANEQLQSSQSTSDTDQELVSDFQHLGIAVKSNEDDASTPTPAAIAARVAYARHSVDEGTTDSKQLHQKSDVSDLRQAGDSASAQERSPISSGHTSNNTSHERTGQSVNDQVPVRDTQTTAEPASEIPSHPDSKDTKIAKPVTHETIRRQNHEIRQEVITRDIHDYHEVTLIQPVIERVVLPARHFVETADGQKVEIPAPKTDIGAVQAEMPARPS